MDGDRAASNPMFYEGRQAYSDQSIVHHQPHQQRSAWSNASANSANTAEHADAGEHTVITTSRHTRLMPEPPSGPPPKRVDKALHEAFDRARTEAARRREVTQHHHHRFPLNQHDVHQVEPVKIRAQLTLADPKLIAQRTKRSGVFSVRLLVNQVRRDNFST